MKILLIEDEPELRRQIKIYLHQEGYTVESANDFNAGENKTIDFDYDCVLVDITLPGGNGLDLIRTLKSKKSKAGIIIISAKNSLDDKIEGLEIGADDYLPKPFHLAELNARIRSLIRRRNFEGNNLIEFNEIKIDTDSQTVSIKNSSIELSPKEYQLLLFFISNKNRVISKHAIAEHLWGDDISMADSLDFIYSHIKNLRKKLVDVGGEDYLKTVYGIGYKFGTK
jgi:DNA-binding response OmpR family regulator